MNMEWRHALAEKVSRSPAKDLTMVKAHCVDGIIVQFPTGPSRENSPVVAWFAKPIPRAQLYDKEASALEDSTKEI